MKNVSIDDGRPCGVVSDRHVGHLRPVHSLWLSVAESRLGDGGLRGRRLGGQGDHPPESLDEGRHQRRRRGAGAGGRRATASGRPTILVKEGRERQ